MLNQNSEQQNIFFKKLPVFFALAVLGFLVFYPLLNMAFTSVDGIYLRQLNPYLSASIPKLSFLPAFIIFTAKKYFGFYPVFLRTLILAFHIINAFLLFKFIQIVFKEKKLFAFISAVLFCFHPLNSLNVYFITGLGDIIALTFILWGLIVFEKNKKLTISLLFFIPALFASPTAVIFPVCVLTLLNKQAKNNILIFSFLIALFFYKSFQMHGFNLGSWIIYFYQSILRAVDVLSITLLPFTNILYPAKGIFWKIFLLFSGIGIFSAVFWTFRRINEKKGLFFMGWVFLWVSPFVLQLKSNDSAGFLYSLTEFNSYGIIIPLILVFCLFFKNIYVYHKFKIIKYGYALLLFSVCFFFFKTTKKHFLIAKNEHSFYKTLSLSYGKNFKNLYLEYLIKENKSLLALEIAEKNLLDSKDIKETSNIYFLMGKLYLNNNHLKKAATYLNAAIKANTENIAAKTELLKVYRKTGLTKKALILAEKINGENSNNANVYYQKGLVYLNTADYDKAFENFTTACRLNKTFCSL